MIGALIFDINAKDALRIQKKIEENFDQIQPFVANSIDELSRVEPLVNIEIFILNTNSGHLKYTTANLARDILENNPTSLIIFQSDDEESGFQEELYDDIDHMGHMWKTSPKYETWIMNKMKRLINRALMTYSAPVPFLSKKNSSSTGIRELMYIKTTLDRNKLEVGYVDRATNTYKSEFIFGMSLKAALALPVIKKSGLFLKVNKSCAINALMIRRVDHTDDVIFLIYGDIEITIGPDYRSEVRAVLKSLNRLFEVGSGG